MNILFLDVDGVLNSVRSAIAFDGYPNTHNTDKFDDISVNLIRTICYKYDVKIVLSSTWRLFKGWEELRNQLQLPIIDKTPHLHLSRNRGGEIQRWLDSHPEVTKYAIIDDDTDMLPHQMEYFVHTSFLPIYLLYLY